MNKISGGFIKQFMCATQRVGSDRYPYVVIDITPSQKTVWLVAIPNDMLKMVQRHPDGYEFIIPTWLKGRKDDSMFEKFTYRKNGRYLPEGTPMNGTGALTFGFAKFYRDPEF